MFPLKEMAISLLSPLPICIWILVAGVMLLWRFPSMKIGKISITFGISLLLFFSLPLFPVFLLGNLERKYDSRAYENDRIEKQTRYIVVLAGGYEDYPKIPIASRFSHQGLLRIVTGIQLYKKCVETKLIVSGGTGGGSIPEAELMAKLSIDLGVPIEDIILESKSTSTFEEAVLIKPIVANNEFFLVTSASHMPRSMALFTKLGMKPLPVPVGYLVKRGGVDLTLIPSPYNLVKSYTFLYEFFGLIKERLLGRA
jgi:uncharacterized SAM-binding protein YcdF (DUF218 family)